MRRLAGWLWQHTGPIMGSSGAIIVVLAVNSIDRTAGWIVTGSLMMAAGLLGAFLDGR